MDNKELIPQMPKGATRSREEGVCSLMARTPLGEVTAEELNAINSVVQDYGLPGVRVTGRQRIMIQGIPEENLQEIIERLGQVGDPNKYFVQACVGSTKCRLGMRDSLDMARRLEDFLNDFELPAKIKSGVAGCSMSCAESYVRDIGMVAKKKGWIVLFGGNAGKGVRKGDVLAEDVSGELALEIIGKALDFYAENAKKKERTARFVERVGIDAVKRAVFGA